MKSLYSKFAITTILIMILSGVLSFIVSNHYYQVTLKKQNDEKITGFATKIAGFASKQKTIGLDDYFTHMGGIGYQILLIDSKGHKQFFGSAFRIKNLPDNVPEKVLNGEIYHGIRNFPKQTFITGFFANELANSVGVPFTYQNKPYAMFIRPDIKLMFNEMHILFGWLLLLTILLSIIMVLVSTNYLVKPIRKLNAATKEISEGNFSIKLDIDRSDELGDLAVSFTNMSRKLDKVEQLRRELISNISHDIQSPLTNIKGYLNFLDDQNLGKKEKTQYIQVVQSEVERLSTITKQLLLLASIESKKDLLKISRFNLAQQLKDVIHQYQWSIGDKGIMMSYSLPDTWINGDSSLLYSVWENLLTNAIKYNNENGNIDIDLIDSGSSIEVTFKDSGIGLEQVQLKRIFDRFYRADTSRTRSVEGTGLGLSIVWSIADLHHGKVEALSQKGKGTTIKVILPKM
ncbi:HAMP domain-containing sensor histidine kinase [Neobacillus niacini]|uniref:HAMP domain-containing sensor histidine kinase n=1 Tax=Neobacillus niacini TaxID=86668 RepID=UPI0028621D57|nr:HAMP domain-containing sensor histidine kinase [Neobacillus niacini]MDR6998390.1 signal transduction histidine kinase [Neobacillus niacini]